MRTARVISVALCAAMVCVGLRARVAKAEDIAPPTADAKPIIKAPVLLNRVKPVYPKEAREQGTTGQVILVLDIDAQGSVTHAEVREPAGHGLDEAATVAAFQLRFEPALRDGIPVASRIFYTIVFEIEAQSEPTSESEADPAPGDVAQLAEPEGTKHEEPLAPAEPALEISVRGERRHDEVTRHVITRQELTTMPGTGGDAIRAMQTMPGVARAPAMDGMLIVRGSSPRGTVTLIDGTFVPAIYHFGGLSSIVPSEMIQSIDFFPGNFSAKYGRAMGGIVDVRLREVPSEEGYHGLAQLDLIDTRFHVRGPIGKGWSFAVGGRRSHLDAWIGSVLKDTVGMRTAPVYYDFQAFAETRPSTNSYFRVGVFGSDDRLSLVLKDPMMQNPGLGNSLSNHNSVLRLQTLYRNHITELLSISASASVGMDGEAASMGPIRADISYLPIAFRGELQWKFARGATLRVGPDIVVYPYRGEARTIRPPEPGQPDAGPFSTHQLLHLKQSGVLSMPAAYSELEWVPEERLKLLVGARADYFNTTGKWDLSPRLNARYDLHHEFPRTTAKLGLGVFHEPPEPLQVVDVFGSPGLRSNRAIHTALGIEQEFAPRFDASLEAFVKDLDHLVVRRALADGSTGFDNSGQGRVVGAEALVRFRSEAGAFAWVAYTLSRSTRVDRPGRAERIFEYDQTHILTVVGSQPFGAGWRVGGRFRLVSGNPYTPCRGGILHAGAGTYICHSGEVLGERLPAFHQLDVRVDKTWAFDAWNLTAYLDLQNAYNRSNPEGIQYNYNFSRSTYQAGLPMIPSLGLRGDF